MKNGQKVKDYVLTEVLGGEGSVQTWLAIKQQKKYVLKMRIVLPINKKLIERQYKIFEMCQHENIMPIIDKFEHQVQSSLYFIIVTQYSPLGNICNDIDEKRKEEMFFKYKIMHHIAEAIEHLHSKKIIHRNIKPQNIISTETVYKLTDFNLAKIMKLHGTRMTTGANIEFYQAPEMEITDKYGLEVDIWAFGITLIEVFYGKRIWDLAEWDGGPSKQFNKLEELIKELYFISDILRNMLVLNPKDRITSAELVKRLRPEFVKARQREDYRKKQEIRQQQTQKTMERYKMMNEKQKERQMEQKKLDQKKSLDNKFPNNSEKMVSNERPRIQLGADLKSANSEKDKVPNKPRKNNNKQKINFSPAPQMEFMGGSKDNPYGMNQGMADMMGVRINRLGLGGRNPQDSLPHIVEQNQRDIYETRGGIPSNNQSQVDNDIFLNYQPKEEAPVAHIDSLVTDIQKLECKGEKLLPLAEKYYELGIQFYKTDLFEKSIKNLTNSFRYIEFLQQKSKESDIQVVHLKVKVLFALGRSYVNFSAPERAIEKLQDALVINEQIKIEDKQLQMNIYNYLIKAYQQFNDIQSCLKFFQKAMTAIDKNKPQEAALLANLYATFAEILIITKKYEEALSFYGNSLGIMKQLKFKYMKMARIHIACIELLISCQQYGLGFKEIKDSFQRFKTDGEFSSEYYDLVQRTLRYFAKYLSLPTKSKEIDAVKELLEIYMPQQETLLAHVNSLILERKGLVPQFEVPT